MEQRTLVQWLKILVIFAAVCGVGICVGALPPMGRSFVDKYPELSYCYWPWLLFLWVLAVPCFMALVLAWKVFTNIEKDNSFCMENAEYLKKFSYLAAWDSAVLFVGNAVYLLLGMNHPSLFLTCILVMFAGIAIAVASACLSHLIRKAALLQEESDLTI